MYYNIMYYMCKYVDIHICICECMCMMLCMYVYVYEDRRRVAEGLRLRVAVRPHEGPTINIKHMKT